MKAAIEVLGSTLNPFLTNFTPHSYIPSGLLRAALSVGSLFRLGVFRGHAHDCGAASEVRVIVYVWFVDFYGVVWNHERTTGTLDEHDPAGSSLFHSNLSGLHVDDTLLYVFLWRRFGIPSRDCSLGGAACGAVMVSY